MEEHNHGLPPGFVPAPLPKNYRPRPNGTVHQIPAILLRRRRRGRACPPVPRPPPAPRPAQYQLAHSFHPPIHPARPTPVDPDTALIARFPERKKQEESRARDAAAKRPPPAQGGTSAKRKLRRCDTYGQPGDVQPVAAGGPAEMRPLASSSHPDDVQPVAAGGAGPWALSSDVDDVQPPGAGVPQGWLVGGGAVHPDPQLPKTCDCETTCGCEITGNDYRLLPLRREIEAVSWIRHELDTRRGEQGEVPEESERRSTSPVTRAYQRGTVVADAVRVQLGGLDCSRSVMPGVADFEPYTATAGATGRGIRDFRLTCMASQQDKTIARPRLCLEIAKHPAEHPATSDDDLPPLLSLSPSPSGRNTPPWERFDEALRSLSTSRRARGMRALKGGQHLSMQRGERFVLLDRDFMRGLLGGPLVNYDIACCACPVASVVPHARM
ncbi:hypothetical protein C8F04DRAFT_1193568 [Mycena alexandri]|uniref:Uncharacterized protein n=1 Tax=Mycena alexandri TaxID=1745969 RepID=A0AAD6WQG3_9AGAR|nr:hypothetical protein C8F04DRAFT_1193568 [Mycena alexandri]